MTEPVTDAGQGSQQDPTAGQEPDQGQQDLATLPAWARDTIAKANKEAAGYRARVRELEPKARRADELDEASRTELERAQAAAETARKQAEDAQAEALRTRVALAHGLPADDLDLLGTGDEETLTKRAKRLADLNEKAAKNTARPGGPLRPGASPATEPGPTPGAAGLAEAKRRGYVKD